MRVVVDTSTLLDDLDLENSKVYYEESDNFANAVNEHKVVVGNENEKEAWKTRTTTNL